MRTLRCSTCQGPLKSFVFISWNVHCNRSTAIIQTSGSIVRSSEQKQQKRALVSNRGHMNSRWGKAKKLDAGSHRRLGRCDPSPNDNVSHCFQSTSVARRPRRDPPPGRKCCGTTWRGQRRGVMRQTRLTAAECVGATGVGGLSRGYIHLFTFV